MTTRRDFLKVISAAGGALSVCGMDLGCARADIVEAGQASDIALGTVKAIVGTNVFVGRDASGLYAMSSLCTHQGCNMNIDGRIWAEAIECACHGSKFNLDGNVNRGPASAPLEHFQLNVDDGTIIVDTSITVAAASRTPG